MGLLQLQWKPLWQSRNSNRNILVSSFQKLSMQHDCIPRTRLEESTEGDHGPLVSSPMGSSYSLSINVEKGIEAEES